MFSFPDQRPDEKVLTIFRKHKIVYARVIAVFILTIVLPLIIFLNIWFYFYPFTINYDMNVGVGLFSCIYLLGGLILTCIAWLNEEFDLFILTDQRLIDITQVSFLKRTVSSTPLKQIQDATSSISGILGTLLNYGNVDVQTAAGDASMFFMDRIPDPAAAARMILNAAHESRKERGETPTNL